MAEEEATLPTFRWGPGFRPIPGPSVDHQAESEAPEPDDQPDLPDDHVSVTSFLLFVGGTIPVRLEDDSVHSTLKQQKLAYTVHFVFPLLAAPGRNIVLPMTDHPAFDDLAFSILLGLREGMKYARTRAAIAGPNRPEKEAAEIAVSDAIAARLRAGPWIIGRKPTPGPVPMNAPIHYPTRPLPRQVYDDDSQSD